MKNTLAINYEDKWIMENWKLYRNWNKLCNAYNKTFATEIKYNTFKSHCQRIGLNFHYSNEQIEWLKSNYPNLGKVETTRQFNLLFDETRSVAAIKKCCLELGLHVTEERLSMKAIENTERFHKKGSIVLRNGYYEIKKPNGKWQRLHRYIWEQHNGKIPNGYKVIFLDDDNTNCDIENLALIPCSHLMLMNKNKLKSEHKEITRTAIRWCDLYMESK